MQPISTLNTNIRRKYSFQKLNHFSLGNNVQQANTSNKAGCLWRDMCVSSNQLNWSLETNRPYHHFEKPMLEEVIISKTNSTFTGKQYAKCSSFGEIHVSLQLSLIGLFGIE
jgi:hypothetical protein